MPDPAQTRSTETQTKTIETTRVQTAFCTAKPETAANREDPTPNALQEPHAFLAGHQKDKETDRPRAATNKNRKQVQSTSTNAAVSNA